MFAFTVNNKGKYPYVGILAEKDGNKAVYYLKGPCKNMFVKLYNEREKFIKDGYMIISYNSMDIISLPTEEPFVEFTTNGVTSYNGHSFAKIEHLKFNTEVWKNQDNLPFTHEDIQQIDNIKMQDIKDNIKFRDCHRLEEIAEGKELVIIGIKEVVHRNKDRYILQFDSLDKLYISNYWFEKEIEDVDLNLNYKIKIKWIR